MNSSLILTVKSSTRCPAKTRKLLPQPLNGIFALSLWDRVAGRALIAQDPIGVCSLHWVHDNDGLLWAASEMKVLSGLCADVAQSPPGHFFSNESSLVKYCSRPWRQYEATRGVVVSAAGLLSALERAVHRDLRRDDPTRPFNGGAHVHRRLPILSQAREAHTRL